MVKSFFGGILIYLNQKELVLIYLTFCVTDNKLKIVDLDNIEAMMI